MQQVGPPRRVLCKAGRARESMDDESASDFDEWCRAKKSGEAEDPHQRLATMIEMANAIAAITSVEISTKTLALHVNGHCVCER